MASSNLKSISRQNMLPPLFQFGEGTFKDTGCFDGEFPSCLKCPLLFCKYDKGPRDTWHLGEGKSAYERYRIKYPEAMKLVEMGFSYREIASRSGVSVRQARSMRSAHRAEGK